MSQGYKHPHPQNNFKHLQLKVNLTFTLYVITPWFQWTLMFLYRTLKYPLAFCGRCIVQCGCRYFNNAYNALLSRLVTVSFTCLFSDEGNIEYRYSDGKKHRSLKAWALPWLPSCRDKLHWGAGRGSMFCTVMEEIKFLTHPRLG